MNKKVDLLLITAPIRFKTKKYTHGDDTQIPPIGLMYIASYLKSKGYDCQILDTGVKNLSLNETIKEIRKIKPKVVGISILTPSTITAVELAKEIKKKVPEVLVCCGGAHLGVDKTFIKRYPYFDFGVTGEGEEIMHKILKDLDNGKKITGLYDGGYIKDLDKLPFPDYKLINFNEYGFPLDDIGNRRAAISIATSRGCPFACTFCSKTDARRHVRYRSPKNIVDEIELNYPLSHKGGYSFIDDTMTLNKKNVIEICKEILKRKLKISWIAMTRADCFTLDLARLLKKSGCRELLFGVESGDPRIRNEVIKKNISNDDVIRAVKICRKVGIRSSIFLMLGFPTEGKKELERTINFPSLANVDMMGLHITVPFPGSEIWDQAIKDKIIPKNLIDLYTTGKYGQDFNFWPKYIPKGLTMKDLEEARAKGIRKFYLSFGFLFRLFIYYLRFPGRIKYDRHLFKTAFSILFAGHSKIQFT